MYTITGWHSRSDKRWEYKVCITGFESYSDYQSTYDLRMKKLIITLMWKNNTQNVSIIPREFTDNNPGSRKQALFLDGHSNHWDHSRSLLSTSVI